MAALQWKVTSMEQPPQIGDRMTGISAAPDASTVRDWIGPEAFGQWRELQGWIDENYPGVFTPEWLDGGKNRGWSLRYKKTRAFCTFLPEYRRFSVVIVFGSAERDKFEERRYTSRSKLVDLYDNARTFPDGKFLTLPIATADDRREVMELLIMKRPPPSRS